MVKEIIKQLILDFQKQLQEHPVKRDFEFYPVNRLTEYLKSQGFKTTKEFVSSALGWFEDCYFLFSVQIFDRSITRRNANMKNNICHSCMGVCTLIWFSSFCD